MIFYLPNCRGSREPIFAICLISCLPGPLPFFLGCKERDEATRGGDEDVDEEGPDVALGCGLGLEFSTVTSIASLSIVLLAPGSYPESLRIPLPVLSCACATALQRHLDK